MTEAPAVVQAQLHLFDLEQFELHVPEPLWQHNARWLKVRDPKKYEAIVVALRERMPILTIATELRCSRHTVRAVRDSDATLAQSRPTWIDKAKQFRDRAVERLAEEVDDIEVDKLPFAVGIVSDKITLAEGGATQRVEVVVPISDLERRLMQQARTGLGRGNFPAMRETAMREVGPAGAGVVAGGAAGAGSAVIEVGGPGGALPPGDAKQHADDDEHGN